MEIFVNLKFLFMFSIISNFKDVFILTRKKVKTKKKINDIKKLADVSNPLNNEQGSILSLHHNNIQPTL